jgi:hypothetical protein
MDRISHVLDAKVMMMRPAGHAPAAVMHACGHVLGQPFMKVLVRHTYRQDDDAAARNATPLVEIDPVGHAIDSSILAIGQVHDWPGTFVKKAAPR